MKSIKQKLSGFLDQYNLKKEVALASVVIAGSLTMAMPSQAGIPVIDGANLGQAVLTATNMIEQVAKSVQQIQQLQQQITQMEREYAALTGARGMGNVLRGGIETELGQWGNASTGGILENRITALKAQFPQIDPAHLIIDNVNSPKQVAALDKTTNVVFKSHAAAEKSLEDVNTMASRIKQLGDQIEGASDTKAALDLQNRLLMEVAMLQAYSIRLEAQGLAHTAVKDQQEIAWAAQTQQQLKRARDGQTGLHN